VERIGVTRTLETVAEAELVLVIVDGSLPLGPEDEEILERTCGMPRMVVMNKCDLGSLANPASAGFRVSAKTGEGLPRLVEGIRSFLAGAQGAAVGESILTNARQNEAVVRAIAALGAAEGADLGTPHEMVALDLYAALSALNELTGEVVTDDILGRIFATFCIGK
jgi:tRNA modification GTPase